jgi:hypothetical protein
MLCDEEIKKQKRPIKYCFWRIVKGRRCPRGVAWCQMTLPLYMTLFTL